MPIHDWTRVEAGIFHDFHHEWISAITRALNTSLLPSQYYALAEQQASGFGPDVVIHAAMSGGHARGAADRIVSEAYGRAYCAAIPGARFELIERAGHFPHLEEPDEFARRVFCFAEGSPRL